MKQATLALAIGELEDLVEILGDQIRATSKSADESGRRLLLSLYLKVCGAAALAGGWAEFDVAQVPWVIPMIQKAIAGVDQVPELTRKVAALEARLKAATKTPAPATKPKPKPKPQFKPAPNVNAKRAQAAAQVADAHRAAIAASP